MTALPDHRHPAVIVVLLHALHDRLNDIQAPRWQREAERGATERRWHICQGCRGEGTVKRGKHRATCAVCKGTTGWKVDDYTGNTAVVENSRGSSAITLLEFWGIAERYAEDAGEPGLLRLENMIERSIAGDLGDEARSRARDEHPSKLHLWNALSVMLRDWPVHACLLYRVHVHGWQREDRLCDHERCLLEDALVMLGALLPVAFRAPLWAVRQVESECRNAARGRWANSTQIGRRDDQIRKYATAGMGVRAIARKLAVNASTVSRVLNRPQAA